MTNEPQKPAVAPASTPATPQQNQGDTKPVEAPSVQPQQK
jgi:hypothetical protein